MGYIEDLQQIGAYGFKEVTGTSSPTSGYYVALVPSGGSADMSATSKEGDNLSAGTYAEGSAILGKFSQVAVTSGTVRAYYSEDQ